MTTATNTNTHNYIYLRRVLIAACAIVAIVVGLIILLGSGANLKDWEAAGFIAAGVGILLTAVIV